MPFYLSEIGNLILPFVYTKEYKEKNKDKRVCEKVPPEKSIDYRSEEANTREEIIVKIPGKRQNM